MLHLFHHENHGKTGKRFGNRLYWNLKAQEEFAICRPLLPHLTEAELVSLIESAATVANPARLNVNRLDVEKFFMRNSL